jgi:NAD-dependent dihydropyrimidine dehydrogenase PreA subunit
MLNAYASNTLVYNSELCNNCGMCSIVCPHAVFALNDEVAELVRPEACMECGACQLNCPTGAITVESGVGCAAAMIRAALTGGKEATCGGDTESSCCSGDVGKKTGSGTSYPSDTSGDTNCGSGTSCPSDTSGNSSDSSSDNSNSNDNGEDASCC